MISIYVDCYVESFQDKNKFQISNLNFLLSLCGTKNKLKRKDRGMMRITV